MRLARRDGAITFMPVKVSGRPRSRQRDGRFSPVHSGKRCRRRFQERARRPRLRQRPRVPRAQLRCPMRRPIALGLSLLLLAGLPLAKAYAQSSQSQDDQRRQAEADDDKKKKEKDKEWQLQEGPLPEQKNSGPCPYAKVLYDAGRYVELKDGQESPAAVGYTGEIENVQAICEYKGALPIHERLAIGFGFGRGPMAKAAHKDYRYWVAVTVRNLAVLNKTYFTVPADFRPGQDRADYVDHVADIEIPRAKAGVSGSNFEILVGFDVTPEMADFNRLGKRFRVNAGGDMEVTKTASAAGPAGAR